MWHVNAKHVWWWCLGLGLIASFKWIDATIIINANGISWNIKHASLKLLIINVDAARMSF
jgi:hypothetical protein